jgi:hypothetical protein
MIMEVAETLTTPSTDHTSLMSSSLIDAVRLDPTYGIDTPVRLEGDEQRDLLQALTAVPDPRRRRGVRYPLASLLAVAVCAVLAGATTFSAIADWATDLDTSAPPPAGLRRPDPGRQHGVAVPDPHRRAGPADSADQVAAPPPGSSARARAQAPGGHRGGR